MNNPFEQLAQEQMVAATKRRIETNRKRAETRQAHVVQSEKDAPMKLGAMEQKLQDSSKQMRSYRAYKKAEYDAMKHHPVYADPWSELAQRTMALTLDNTDEFANYIAAQHWLLEAEDDVRRVTLSFIANRLITIRLENGLPPMDDSLPFSDEEPTLFETIRQQLKVT